MGPERLVRRRNVCVHEEGKYSNARPMYLSEADQKQAETFHGKPWFDAVSAEHGTNGPLHVEPYDLELAPISKLMMESMQSKGMPLIDDLFTTGETPNGCGHAVRTVHDGVRTTSADFLTKFEDRIDIVVGTMVDKVNLDTQDGEVVATSVEVVNSAKERRVVRARREVIVSGGTWLCRSREQG
jgi:choline dehydrogenase-like flavoprotein